MYKRQVGHNELSLTDKNQIGADFLREKILDSQYDLKSLELEKGIPEDTSVLAILNPQIEFLDSEIKHLKKFVKSGGSLLVTLSPHFNGVMITKFLAFLEDLGVNFHNGIILDRLAGQQGSQASIPVINNYGKHSITKGFIGRTLFPISSYLTTHNREFTWTALVQSTPFPGSWGENSFDEVKSGTAKFNKVVDFKGPLDILTVGENQRTSARVAVASSTSFITNQFQGQTNNFNLFLNTLSWVVKEEALMSLNRPTLNGQLIYISDIHLSIIFYFAILGFPFVYFGIAIFFYRKRLSS